MPSSAQKQLKPGINSSKLKVPAIKAPDVTVPVHRQQPARANRTSVPAVQADATASTQQQPSATAKRGRAAAPGSSHRRQPGGGNKGKAPAATSSGPLPSSSHQQHTVAGNKNSAPSVSKAAAQHTLAAPAARHSQSKPGVQSSHAHSRSRAGVQSSHVHSRSNVHTGARRAAQKQPPAAAWKTQSHIAAQHSTSSTTRRQQSSFGGPSSNAQPSQPGQGPSAPMSYAKAATKGVPQELLVMDRVPMDNLVFPYLPSERDSAEEQQAKERPYASLMELATGQHRIRSCRHIAGKLD